MSKDKEFEIAAILHAGIVDMLNNEDNEFYVEIKEKELTQFMHALGNLVPNLIYTELTGNETDNLEFNHIMNKLCFQFSKGTK